MNAGLDLNCFFFPVDEAKLKMNRKTSTSDFLKQLVGRPVVVKLNNGLDYRGVLSCLDGLVIYSHILLGVYQLTL